MKYLLPILLLSSCQKISPQEVFESNPHPLFTSTYIDPEYGCEYLILQKENSQWGMAIGISIRYDSSGLPVCAEKKN